MDAELTRLQCRCAFSDGAKRIEQLLLDLETRTADQSVARKVAKLKAAVSELRKLHADHVTQYGPAYARSLVELCKVHYTNPVEMAPLRTTAYGANELLKFRDPPKKRTKKQATIDKKKRKTSAPKDKKKK
jgi:hypothetical protein